MKLSENTLALLENFSSINSNLRINPGNKLLTVNTEKTVYAETHIEETFETQFGIYDLKEWLSVLSMFEDPELTFNDKVLRIVDSVDKSMWSNYYSASMDVLTPVKEIEQSKLKGNGAAFELTSKDFARLSRGANTLKLHDLKFMTEEENGKKCVKAIVYDASGAIQNTVQVSLQDNYDGPEFNVHLKIAKMLIIGGDYTVDIVGTKALLLKNKNCDLIYVIALDVDE